MNNAHREKSINQIVEALSLCRTVPKEDHVSTNRPPTVRLVSKITAFTTAPSLLQHQARIVTDRGTATVDATTQAAGTLPGGRVEEAFGGSLATRLPRSWLAARSWSARVASSCHWSVHQTPSTGSCHGNKETTRTSAYHQGLSSM